MAAPAFALSWARDGEPVCGGVSRIPRASRSLCSLAGEDERRARIAAFDAVLEAVGEGVDVEPPAVPPLVEAFFHGR